MASDRPNRVTYINEMIPHIQQFTKNDCGIACFKMALNYLFKEESAYNEKIASLTNTLNELKINDTSLWTIDIAYLCSKNKLQHEMFTQTFGVTETYNTELFYTIDQQFSIEQTRINKLFNDHIELGINVAVREVPLDVICEKVADGWVCIVLVDAARLCESGKEYQNAADEKTSYLGHFIVVIGYDNESKRILYRNSAKAYCLCTIDYHVFEEARKSYGTDQDILFINS